MRITVPGINTSGDASGGGLVLKGVTVVDTRTGELTPGRAVLIRHGKIQQIVSPELRSRVKSLKLVSDFIACHQCFCEATADARSPAGN